MSLVHSLHEDRNSCKLLKMLHEKKRPMFSDISEWQRDVPFFYP